MSLSDRLLRAVSSMWDSAAPALGSAMPLVIAGIVAYIAYQQWITARDKLRLELFERRFSNFQRVKSELDRTLELIMQEAWTPPTPGTFDNRLSAFWSARQESELLFGADVSEELRELDANLSAILYWRDHCSHSGEPYDQFQVPLFGTAIRVHELIKIYGRYLRVGHVGVARAPGRFRLGGASVTRIRPK